MMNYSLNTKYATIGNECYKSKHKEGYEKGSRYKSADYISVDSIFLFDRYFFVVRQKRKVIHQALNNDSIKQ